MNIDSIQNGVVLDHIQAGKSMDIYRYLHLDQLDCSVAIIKNVRSGRMGKKDIIKIDSPMEVDLDVLGYIDPNITVNIIRNGVRVEKKHLELPKKLVNVIHCKNPRLHHRSRAPAGRHIPAERSRHSHLSLRLLRDREGQEVLIPRDGHCPFRLRGHPVFSPPGRGRIYGFCIAGKFSCNAEFFCNFCCVLEENGVYCGPDFRKRRHSYEASSLLDRSAQLRDHSRSGLSDGRQL